ncbi:MAG: hypothetical protein U1E31_03315 [Rickettsiales bacterium]
MLNINNIILKESISEVFKVKQNLIDQDMKNIEKFYENKKLDYFKAYYLINKSEQEIQKETQQQNLSLKKLFDKAFKDNNQIVNLMQVIENINQIEIDFNKNISFSEFQKKYSSIKINFPPLNFNKIIKNKDYNDQFLLLIKIKNKADYIESLINNINEYTNKKVLLKNKILELQLKNKDIILSPDQIINLLQFNREMNIPEKDITKIFNKNIAKKIIQEYNTELNKLKQDEVSILNSDIINLSSVLNKEIEIFMQTINNAKNSTKYNDDINFVINSIQTNTDLYPYLKDKCIIMNQILNDNKIKKNKDESALLTSIKEFLTFNNDEKIVKNFKIFLETKLNEFNQRKNDIQKPRKELLNEIKDKINKLQVNKIREIKLPNNKNRILESRQENQTLK